GWSTPTRISNSPRMRAANGCCWPPDQQVPTMYTQCPKCLTVFSVTEEILAVKAGLVRCGDCENVFNATWNLVDEYEYENEYDDDSSTTWTGDDAVAGDHVEPAVESPPI